MSTPPIVGGAQEVELTAPDAEQRPHVHTEHGVQRPDPYHWMRDREDGAVIEYLEAENAYMRTATAHLEGLRKTLFDEILGRIQEDDQQPPVFKDGYWYYVRTEAGQPYPIYCRKQGTIDANEEIYLDVNELGAGKDYISVGNVSVSPDHRTLAYSVDETGRELYELRFRDLTTGEELPDKVSDIWPNVVWSTDQRTVFYTRLDDSLRPYQVARHTLGQSTDPIVYVDEDSKFRVYVYRTRDKNWIFVGSSSSTTSELHSLPAGEPGAELTLFSARHNGCEYEVDSQGDRFLVLTNDHDDPHGQHDDGALNFEIKTASPGATRREDWKTLIEHRDAVTVLGVDAFAGHLVITEREAGLKHLRYLTNDGSVDRRLRMPEPVYVLSGSSNPTFSTTKLRFSYSSLVTPDSIYEVELPTDERALLKQQVVKGGYDAQAYTSARTYATAPDGTKVPISIVHRADVPLDGKAPLLLYGYGAYGITIEPSFRSTRLTLLDRGVIFAIAHVRGGGFLGRPWKENGKFEHKVNTFTDFIASGRHLVAKGYSTHERMAIQGGSAGGLLIGAVINMAPDLASQAVAQVPFVDVVTTMLDESIPLTTNEWEEWGDPRERKWFDVMLAYSPYDNVREGTYPDLLVTSGLNDPRVQYWEPSKWVARLRDRVTGDSQILLKMEMGTGHGGKSGRYGRIEDAAFVYAWMLDNWGLAGD